MVFPSSIAIFRALNLGDLLCAIPAFRALRYSFPNAHISLIGLPKAKELVERFSKYLNEFIEFPGFCGLPEREFDSNRFQIFVHKMHKRKFDLAIQLHGDGSVSNDFMNHLDARILVGYCKSDAMSTKLSHLQLFPYPDNLHEIHRNLQLLENIGLETYGDHLEFPIFYEDEYQLANFAFYQNLIDNGQFICIHPGARAQQRRWSPHSFAEVGDYFAERGYQIVLTGSKSEANLIQEVANAMHYSCIDTASFDLHLGTLAVLLKKSQLVISNDTGVSHLAVALRKTSVTIFLKPELILRWAPLDRKRHRIVQQRFDLIKSIDVINVACEQLKSYSDFYEGINSKIQLASRPPTQIMEA